MEYVHIKFGKGKVTIAFKPESGSISIKMGFCSPEEKHFCKAKGREEATKKEKPVLVVNYDSNLCSARRFVYLMAIELISKYNNMLKEKDINITWIKKEIKKLRRGHK